MTLLCLLVLAGHGFPPSNKIINIVTICSTKSEAEKQEWTFTSMFWVFAFVFVCFVFALFFEIGSS